jgi:hypothetical protein
MVSSSPEARGEDVKQAKQDVDIRSGAIREVRMLEEEFRLLKRSRARMFDVWKPRISLETLQKKYLAEFRS